jgi:thiosulfate reductase / polysulfide reductase chain A
MKKINRRDFIKISSVGTAGAALSMGLMGCNLEIPSLKVFGGGSELDPRFGYGKDVTIVPTSCQVCYWGCGVHAHVVDGKIWKLTGNPDDPLCAGRLCPRGTAATGLIYDPDRLKEPLMRVDGENGQSFKAVSWEKALDNAAEKLTEIKDKYGPESIAVITHGKPGHFFEHLVRAIGSPNHSVPSFSLCRGARDVAYWLTFGKQLGSPEPTDIENSKVMVLLGYHLGENMHTTQVREFATFVKNANEGNAKLVVVDPRFSIAAGKAWKWLPIRPGTDMALLQALINVLLNEEPDGRPLYNVDYVNKYTTGLDELRATNLPYTPEWAWPITGIEPKDIREVAYELSKNSPHVLVHPGRFSSWDGNDVQRIRANAILNALLGGWGHKGGFFVSDKASIPKYPDQPYPKPEKGGVDKGEYPLGPFPSVNNIIKAALTEKPYPIKALVVAGSNILSCLPRPSDTIKAIKNLDFFMVADTLPVEQTGYADLVLPDCTYLERMDEISVKNFKQNFVTVNQPVVEPLHNSKPGWWMCREIGLRMGLDKYFGWKDIEEYNDTRLKAAGLTLKELTKTGIVPLATGPVFLEEGKGLTFSTPTGKIELSSSHLSGFGQYPVPVFENEPVKPGPDFFFLTSGRSPLQSFSRSQNNRISLAVDNGNQFWINVDSARSIGVRDGKKYYLQDKNGVKSTFKAKAKVTHGIRPDTIYLTHGFGHEGKKLRAAFGVGVDDAKLITKTKADPIMGATGMRGSLIKVVV